MTLDSGQKIQLMDLNKRKCNVITCVHYAGGFCQEPENECEFIERAGVQEC